MDVGELARRIRVDCLKLCHDSKTTHVGSALSCVDIVAVIYGEVLQEGDSFVLSKGHAASAVWSALVQTGRLDPGKFPDVSPDEFPPGVAFSTGALGHGIPVACGLALADPEHQVYVLVGDGETNEGSNWEAALFAAANELKNLTVIVDRNHLQAYGGDVLKMGNISAKFKVFGWHGINCDGHDHEMLAKYLPGGGSYNPRAVVCDTTKGKGVSFMEDELDWHYLVPDDEQLACAIAEVEA